MPQKQGKKGKHGGGGENDKEALAPSGRIWRPREANDKYTVHSFRNLHSIYSVSGTGTGVALGGSYIAFDQLANYGLYTALYDQYRFDCVEVIFNLARTPTTAENFPRINVFPDFDDATPPATLANAQSHPRVVTHVFTAARPSFSIKFVPRLAVATYGPVSSIYGSNTKAMFIDCNSPAAQHFGYKFAVEGMWTGCPTIDISYRVWFTCRNPV